MSTQTDLPSSGDVQGIKKAQRAAMPVATRLKDLEAVAITAPNMSGKAKAATLKDCNMWLARSAGIIAAKAKVVRDQRTKTAKETNRLTSNSSDVDGPDPAILEARSDTCEITMKTVTAISNTLLIGRADQKPAGPKKGAAGAVSVIGN